jgi:hypothetical protein
VAQSPNTKKMRLFCKAKELGWLHFTLPEEIRDIRVDVTRKTSNEHERINMGFDDSQDKIDEHIP